MQQKTKVRKSTSRSKDVSGNRSSNLRPFIVNLSDRELLTIKKLSDEQQVNAEEILKRALATENYMRTKLIDGFKVLVQSKDGQMFEVQFND